MFQAIRLYYFLRWILFVTCSLEMKPVVHEAYNNIPFEMSMDNIEPLVDSISKCTISIYLAFTLSPSFMVN